MVASAGRGNKEAEFRFYDGDGTRGVLSSSRAAYRAMTSISMFNRAPIRESPESGDFQRVWNDQNGERVAFDLIDRERHAIQRNRTFGRDVSGEPTRRPQSQPRHVGQIFAPDQLGDAIDVAAHHMAAKFVAEAQRPFEVEPCSGPPALGGRHAQRFGGCVDAEPGPVALAAARHHCEADPGTSDRCPDVDRVRVVATSNG